MNSNAPERILIVEDESITALDIQQSLQRKGYAVPGIAVTGLEALDLARRHQPSLVLMDIRLRGQMDGIEAARLIHQELNLPVVFLTAFADCTTLQRAKSAEPFAYLLKPFEEEVLVTTIEVALHKHRAYALLVQQNATALQLSEERFRQLAENVPECAILLLEPGGRIVSWNRGAEQLHGWDAGEALGQSVALLYPAEEVARQKPDRDLAAAARNGRHTDYASQMRKDRTRFSAQTVTVALRDQAQNLAGFLKVSHPVSPGGQHN